MAACGLDFGTSNTTLGIGIDGAPSLVPLEGTHRTLPSAIFFAPGREGRSAVPPSNPTSRARRAG